MTRPVQTQAIHLASRPQGVPKLANFELATCKLPPLAANEFLVENYWMSVDPYMRQRMRDRKSYIPPFQVGEALSGGNVGQVIESNHPEFKTGDWVADSFGWRRHYISGGGTAYKVNPKLAPLQAFLGVLGLTGFTAYIGLLKIAALKPNETVFVSAAAGAVGSIVCQLAKLKGCRVIGSVGSEDKVNWLLDELQCDSVINYKITPSLDAALAMMCPEGIDVTFENVGGAHLEAALNNMNNYGRIAVCGMISQYNNETPEPGPKNLGLLITKRLRMQGFIARDYEKEQAQAMSDLAVLLADGKLKAEETIVDGLEQAPQAFLDLFDGKNLGKMLVKLNQ